MNKFNVINKLKSEVINYDSIIKNYLENQLESDINIYHPDYIYQLSWNNKITNDDKLKLFNDSISNLIIQKRQNIRNLIKKEKFDLISLNQFINNLNNKILKIENILCIKTNCFSDNIRSILSDPLLINYMESEFAYLDNDIVTNIQNLTKILSKCPEEDYNWFLKLVGSVLRNNIVSLNVAIPEKYKYLYELNNTIEYTYKVTKSYKFLGDSILVLLNPIYEIILSKFINCINNCNLFDLYNLIDNKSSVINKIFKDKEKKLIISSISFRINKNITDIESLAKIKFLLKLIIKCKDLDLLENYILLIFENEKIIDSIFQLLHLNIGENNLLVKNIISLIKVKNKDEFMMKYHKLLIERVLSLKIKPEDELIVIQELVSILGLKVTNKSLKVINDYKRSIEDNEQFNKFMNINNFNIITTSYSNWDINYTQGYVTTDINCEYNSQKLIDLESYLQNYQIYYQKIYENRRKLLWLLQYGEILITYENIDIVLLPIQLLVLELFNVKYAFTYDELLSQSFFNNYSNKFKEDIISSLINGNILINDFNKLYLNESNLKIISNNFIEIYLSNNIVISTIDTSINLAHEREDIIKTLINHNLKQTSMSKDMLFDKLERNISIFKLTKELFNNTVDKMIKFDYITYDGDTLIKCIY